MRNSAKTRTCTGCGKKGDKSEFIRISKSQNGEFSIDSPSGRGAYICKDAACLEKAIKRKRISAVLRGPVPQEIYSRLSQLTGSDQD